MAENNKEQNQDLKFIRMTTEAPEKLILKLAIPTIISMLITTIYNLADTFFVGQLNQTSATGAVSVAFSLMNIIQATGFFFGHGSGNYISRELGKKNIKDAKVMASVGFFSAFIAGTVISILVFIFIDEFVLFLGATPTIKPYAKEYIFYILLGSPFMCSSLVLNNELRFQGNAMFSMIGLTVGGVLNIILDPIFIFTLNMGVKGAAIATVTSQFISFSLLLIGIQKSDSLSIGFKNFKPSFKMYKNILIGGTPSLARQGLAAVSSICFNTVAGGYGDAAVAAIGIVNRIMHFASSALIGFGQGFQPVCGFNYGAKLYKRVEKSFYFCVKYAVIFLTFMSAILFLLSPNLIKLFQENDPEVIRIGTATLKCQLVTFPLMSWVIMSNMMTQTIGKVYKATILAMSRQGLMFIPSILILNYLFSLNGLIISQATADFLSFALALPLQISEVKSLKRLSNTLQTNSRSV